MTWIALDGNLSDWPQNAPVTTDGTSDASILSLNIREVRAIYNDSYLYMSIETISQPNPSSQIELGLSTTGTNQMDTLLTLRPGHVLARQDNHEAVLVPDADMAVGNVIELRVPLRLTGTPPHIVDLCLSSAVALAFPQAPDCMESSIQIGRVNQIDPAPLRYSANPMIAVRGDGRNPFNVRAAPSSTAKVLITAPVGTIYAAIGRTADGKWIQIENAAYMGWIGRETLFTPGNLDSLPVTG